MDIRANLALYLDDKGLKKSAVARKAGMTAQQLCATVKKRRELNADELFNLCDVLEITPEELRNYTNTKTNIEPCAPERAS